MLLQQKTKYKRMHSYHVVTTKDNVVTTKDKV